MYYKKYVIMILCACIMLLNVIILDTIDIKMCKSFSIYRIFTMNSTVCTHISTSIAVLEKTFTTILIGTCSILFQEFVTPRIEYEKKLMMN